MNNDAMPVPDSAAQARDDLAFLRGIVDEKSPFARNFGVIYMAGGFCYGLQCLFAWLFLKIGEGVPTTIHLVNAILPTVVFIGVMIFGLVRDRKVAPLMGPVARGIEAAFQGTGLANVVLIAVFGVAALRASDLSLWLFYPATVCVLQGAVWYGAARLRRRLWMGVVAAGWLVAGLVAGLSINSIETYIAVLGLALFALMGVPGWIVWRINTKA